MIVDKTKHFFSLVKFSHTIFALPFALLGFFLALDSSAKPFDWKLFVCVILCMVFARNSAMGFNRYADRKIDILNPRTKQREIPAGIISSKTALWFVIANVILFIATTFFINGLVFYLSPVALIVILGYSYTKKFTALCHFVLGLGLSLAPIGAYLTVTGAFALLPVIYSFVVLLWVSGFDIIYSLQDEEFDKSQQLFSVPAKLGIKNAILLSQILHLVCAGLVILAFFLYSFSYLYIVGSLIFISLLIYQHTLVKPNDFSRINIAFMTTNGIASVIFAVFTISDLVLF